PTWSRSPPAARTRRSFRPTPRAGRSVRRSHLQPAWPVLRQRLRRPRIDGISLSEPPTPTFLIQLANLEGRDWQRVILAARIAIDVDHSPWPRETNTDFQIDPAQGGRFELKFVINKHALSGSCVSFHQ